VANIQLPKDTKQPSFDLLTLDSRVGRLYVAHSSMDAIDIVDIKNNQVVASVGGLFKVHAVALTADPNIVMTSDPAEGMVAVVDVAQRKVLKKVDTGPQPDSWSSPSPRPTR